MLIMSPLPAWHVMGDRHAAISGEWADHSMNTEHTPLAPDAPRRMHENAVTEALLAQAPA